MRQRKKAKMYKLVESWRSSGQSKREFSKAKEIKAHVLYYWIKQYEKDNLPVASSEESNNFIPLQVATPLSVATPLTLLSANQNV